MCVEYDDVVYIVHELTDSKVYNVIFLFPLQVERRQFFVSILYKCKCTLSSSL